MPWRDAFVAVSEPPTAVPAAQPSATVTSNAIADCRSMRAILPPMALENPGECGSEVLDITCSICNSPRRLSGEKYRFLVRMPEELRPRLVEAAARAGRSLNAELVHRLERSLDEEPAAPGRRYFGRIERPGSTRQ